MIYLSKLKSHKNIFIKTHEAMLEIVEHAVGSMCLTLTIINTCATRELNPHSYSQQKNLIGVSNPIGQGSPVVSETAGNI